MGLTKQQILEANDRKVEMVPTPKWGGDVFVRPLDGDSRDEYDRIVSEKRWPAPDPISGATPEPDWRGLRAALCALGMCDENGTLMGFTELEVIALGHKDGETLDRVHRKIRDISGLNIEAIEEAEKNSPGDQKGNSGSSSPSPTDVQSKKSNK